MSRIFISGSSTGLGLMAADLLVSTASSFTPVTPSALKQSARN